MKNEVKSTKRLFRRGNVLDIVILLLVVAAVASVVIRYYQTANSREDKNAQTVRISFEIEQALPGIADAVAQGDTLRLTDGTAFGTLETHGDATGSCPLSVEAADILLQDADGNYVNAPLVGNGVVDLEGVLKCTGAYDEHGSFLLDGRYSISPGQRVAVLHEKAAFVLCVTDIERVN